MSRPLLSLFDVPDIRTDAPSAPGSDTSRQAAATISNPFRRASHRRIMAALGALNADTYASQWAIGQAADLPINVICARIPELEPLWIERERGACRSHVKPSLKVDGFRLTVAGRRRLAQAERPL